MPADEKGAVAVPRGVYEGIVAVRDSGLTNMLDRPRVAEIAEELGYAEAAEWISSNKKAYAEGVFSGFAPEGGEAPPPRVTKGMTMRYVGDLHPGLRGCKVRVVGPIRRGWWEITPWIEQEGRWSWVTSDARPEDLAPLEEEEQ
jgi:hypothetical protein